MKRKKITAITCMLAATAVSATLGGVLLGNGITSADESVVSYTHTKIFSMTNSATVAANDDNTKTEITLPTASSSVLFKNDLAYQWKQDGKDEYLSVGFRFVDTNFKSVTFEFDAPSAWATKDDKTTNTVTFTKKEGGFGVKVNDKEIGDDTFVTDKDWLLTIGASLDNNDGEYAVFLKEDVENSVANQIGTFVNVGANFVERTSGDMEPLRISAEYEANAEASVIYLNSINKQRFDDLTDDGKIIDNAAPVLVVNEPIDGFILGAAFDLEYSVVDVLKADGITKPLYYYQYNPDKTGEITDDDYEDLDTSVYFMPTVYKKDGKETTVFAQENAEFFLMKAELDDGAKTNEVDFIWYATQDAIAEKGGVKYIRVDRNENGAVYAGIEKNTTDPDNPKNIAALTVTDNAVIDLADYKGENAKENALNAIKDKLTPNAEYTLANADAFKEDYAQFVYDLLSEAKNVSAGSNAKVNIPSLKWLINDNNGYRNLKFTISYKTPSSDTPTSNSALSYGQLKLSVADAGWYEFKVVAVDEAGNEMKYYDEDGELVSVTDGNVWDIEEIPSFRFQIKTAGMKVEDPSKASNKKDTVILNKTYTLDDFDVTGANEDKLKKEHALYKVDLSKFSHDDKKISQSTLTAVSYEELTEEMDVLGVKDGDYFSAYLTTYAKLLAKEIGIDATDEIAKEIVEKCFERIGEVDDRNGEMDEDGNYVYAKYNWDAESKSFDTVEEGTYMIFADYYDAELTTKRASAFMVIVVESEADYIKGETEWLKNNIVSVVLFSIAGVMLILIIILLLVKPSDETLEDVEAKAAVKKEKKEKSKKDK